MEDGKTQRKSYLFPSSFHRKDGQRSYAGARNAVYAVANVTDHPNGIAAYERDASRGIISNEVKNAKIAEIIKDVSLADRRILISCMCLIPAVFLAVALIIYKKKCILTESRLAEMIKETEARKVSDNPPAEEVDATPQTENAA